MKKLVVGLGNPGQKYRNNRHNAGHMFVAETGKMQERAGEQMSGVRVLKTDSFMNESGKFVVRVLDDWGNKGDWGGWGKNLFIVHDDLDLPLGKFKIQFGVGPKVHYGVQSVETELGTGDFWRIRVGVDNRDSGQARMTGEKYVLEDFTGEEKKILEEVFLKIWEELTTLVRD